MLKGMVTSATRVSQRPWGIAPDGSAVQCFTLANDDLQLEVISYGARVASVHVPDRHGNLSDVILGFGALEPYTRDKAFLGCTVGRYANRIAKGRFVLDGTEYTLSVNNGPNTLHGGADGLWHKNWTGTEIPGGVEFTLSSPDGDQGFPGAVSVVARFRLEGNSVDLEVEATTDRLTVVNLTNHAYFNLAGEGSGTILDHRLQINADGFTPVDETAIPLGEIAAVQGTPFDFTTPHAIGDHIHDADEQLNNGHGYDHNYVLRGEAGELRTAAVATDPVSGRRLTVQTTQPGMQFYTGNYLDSSMVGRGGSPYRFREGFCLETQHFPDSPNQPAFPSTELRPGEHFTTRTVWTFTSE